MKTNKRALAIMTAAFMAMTPVAATGLTAFAEGETAAATYDITVDATKAADSDFAAYQIFSGTVSGGKLTGIQWGSGMPSADATKMAAFLSALQKEDAFKVGEGGANVFASLTAAATSVPCFFTALRILFFVSAINMAAGIPLPDTSAITRAR